MNFEKLSHCVIENSRRLPKDFDIHTNVYDLKLTTSTMEIELIFIFISLKKKFSNIKMRV